MCVACGVHVHAVNSQNYFNNIFKIAVRENLERQKFSAVQYSNPVIRDTMQSTMNLELLNSVLTYVGLQ